MTCGARFQPYRAAYTTCSRLCRERLPENQSKRARYGARLEVRERKNEARRVSVNPARREINRRQQVRRYGVTLAWYEEQFARQGGRCAICRDEPDPNGIRAASRLHVDHDHENGQVRELLCGRCNAGIGHFREDPDRLRAAVAYIERHRSTQ